MKLYQILIASTLLSFISCAAFSTTIATVDNGQMSATDYVATVKNYIPSVENVAEFTYINGTKVIKAGSHSAAQNKIHDDYCKQQLGSLAKDVTDDSDIIMGENTVDAVFCMARLENSQYKAYLPVTKAGVLERDYVLKNNEKPSEATVGAFNAPTIHVKAVNANIDINNIWYLQNIGYFYHLFNNKISFMSSVPSFDCFAYSKSFIISGDLVLTNKLVCSKTSRPLVTENYATGYIDDIQSAQAKGIISFN